MNLSEHLAKLSLLIQENSQNNTQVLTEAKGHLDHPEDLVFINGGEGAKRALAAIESAMREPEKFTIKWDGYPALIFGRGTDGRFICVDKHMFNRADGSGRKVYSPQQFIKYDTDRGVIRSQLHRTIPAIWRALERADTKKTGFYWGDLIFDTPLQVQRDGLYHFQANPNGIRYTLEPEKFKQATGIELDDKIAGIAVHQYLDPNAPQRAAEESARTGEKIAPTDMSRSLDGTLGNLRNVDNVAIIPSKMPITPRIRVPTALLTKARDAVTSYNANIDTFFQNSTQYQSRKAFGEHFTKYVNRRIVGGSLDNLVNGFIEYMNTVNMTSSMRAKLMGTDQQDKNGRVIHRPGYIDGNMPALKEIFSVWIALYNLKNAVVKQLQKAADNAPVQGYLQDGRKSQEGFVSHGLKFIDRLGFSAQNLGGR